MHFSEVKGDGRVDITSVDSLTNHATTQFYVCSAKDGTNNGDDPDTITWQPLPSLFNFAKLQFSFALTLVTFMLVVAESYQIKQ